MERKTFINPLKVEVKKSLDKYANKFWKDMGAKIGKVQTIGEFDAKVSDYTYFASLPGRISKDPNAKFRTVCATIEPCSGFSKQLECALHVSLILKDGSESKNTIKLTWASFDLYDTL